MGKNLPDIDNFGQLERQPSPQVPNGQIQGGREVQDSSMEKSGY